MKYLARWGQVVKNPDLLSARTTFDGEKTKRLDTEIAFDDEKTKESDTKVPLDFTAATTEMTKGSDIEVASNSVTAAAATSKVETEGCL
ncbi:hypothetical protein FNV43_RR00777 [Rhamnella rubrinervis]|uniref:Uncharacterized protein n=1 Tax=Rhamnella rubrinervis TaxID=2594499 RepID=A0A8K0HPS7_9ROSA|nr:hypothetical protein FNV43_RR00777 [Rhamnella rubrinervis]